MSLTQEQDIPNRPVVSEPWSKRMLISLKNTGQTLAESFSALEVVLFFMILVSGLGELLGRHLSSFWYILVLLVLVASFGLRFYPLSETTKTKTLNKKK